MAKPTKRAGLICLVLSILAVAGGVCAYFLELPVILVAALLPASVYELLRTEGASTRLSSLLVSLVLLAQIVVLVAGIRFDLPAVLRSLSINLPLPAELVSLSGVLAVVAAILAVVLFSNTRGVYTRWLAVIVFVGSLGLLYLLAPAQIAKLLR